MTRMVHLILSRHWSMNFNVEILSTGGTAGMLEKSELK
jgi:AICAR transformylase/IMP cyclohydrolase PurH